MSRIKALIAAAALSLTSAAFAATVKVSDISYIDFTGDGENFSVTKSAFTLDTDTWVTGSLITVEGDAPSIDIQTVALRNLTSGQSLSWTETLAVDWNLIRVGLEQWSFSTQQLSAGQWVLDVTGTAWGDKIEQGFTATVELPEPDAGALAAVAVLGALVASRRRKA
jgi:MYXO-CTERM domain-containing protein